MIFLCCYRMVVIPENCVLLIFWFSILEISLKWDRTKQMCRFLIIFVLNKAELEGKAVRASTRPLWSDPQLLFFAFDKANSSYVYLWAWSSLLLAVGKVVFHPVLLELEGLCICKYLLVWTVFASLSIARFFFFLCAVPTWFFHKIRWKSSTVGFFAMLKLLLTVSRGSASSERTFSLTYFYILSI